MIRLHFALGIARRRDEPTRRWVAWAMIAILLCGVIAFSLLGKSGQYLQRTTSAHQISKSAKFQDNHAEGPAEAVVRARATAENIRISLVAGLLPVLGDLPAASSIALLGPDSHRAPPFVLA